MDPAERLALELLKAIAAIDQQSGKIAELTNLISLHGAGKIVLPPSEFDRIREELATCKAQLATDAKRCVDAYDDLVQAGVATSVLDEWRRTMKSQFGI